MKILVFGLGSAGDVHPNAGLGLALQERGHRVVLVAASVFEPLVRRLGLDFAGAGTEEEYNDAIQDPDLWHPWRCFNVVANRLMLPWMRRTYEMIANARESGGYAACGIVSTMPPWSCCKLVLTGLSSRFG